MSRGNSQRYMIFDGRFLTRVTIDKRRQKNQETGRSSYRYYGGPASLQELARMSGCSFLVRARAKLSATVDSISGPYRMAEQVGGSVGADAQDGRHLSTDTPYNSRSVSDASLQISDKTP